MVLVALPLLSPTVADCKPYDAYSERIYALLCWAWCRKVTEGPKCSLWRWLCSRCIHLLCFWSTSKIYRLATGFEGHVILENCVSIAVVVPPFSFKRPLKEIALWYAYSSIESFASRNEIVTVSLRFTLQTTTRQILRPIRCSRAPQTTRFQKPVENLIRRDYENQNAAGEKTIKPFSWKEAGLKSLKKGIRKKRWKICRSAPHASWIPAPVSRDLVALSMLPRMRNSTFGMCPGYAYETAVRRKDL